MHDILDWLRRLAATECLFVAWGYAAFAVATRLLPSSGVALRWTAAGVVGLWFLSVGFHLLLALSSFTLPWALVLASSAAIGSFVACGGVAPARRFASDVTYLRDLVFRWTGRPGPLLATWVGAFVALIIAVRATLLPVVAWDSLTYHAVKAGMWVQQGGPLTLVAPGGFSIYRDYPGGGELLHAWTMLPLMSDALTGVVDAAIWLALGVAVHALGAQFGLSRTARFTGAAYVLAIPAVARGAGSLYVDNALALALVAACALALHPLRRPGTGPVGPLILVGMAFGVGIGIKIFALPVAVVALAMLGLLLWTQARGPAGTGGAHRVLLGAASGSAALAAAAVPWFVNNWMRTGYPLSPFPLEVAGVTLGRANPALLWYMDRPSTAAAGMVDELRALAETFGVPSFTPLSEPTLGVVSLVVALVAGFSLVRLFRRDTRAALLMLAFVAPMVGSYYGAGLKNTRLIWASVSGRYLLAAVALCVVLSLACCRRRGAWQTGYQALLWIAAVAYLAVSDVRGWTGIEALAGGATALVVLALVSVGHRLSLRPARIVVPVLLLAAGGSLVTVREATRDHLLRHGIALHASPRYWIPALAALEAEPWPRTVAVTAGASQDNDNWMLYPFLGRRLQNTLVYVPITDDGTIIDLANNEARLARASYDAWRKRLSARGVSTVVSFAPQSLELFWMERHPVAFRRLAGDGSRWGVYQFGAEDAGD